MVPSGTTFSIKVCHQGCSTRKYYKTNSFEWNNLDDKLCNFYVFCQDDLDAIVIPDLSNLHFEDDTDDIDMPNDGKQ